MVWRLLEVRHDMLKFNSGRKYVQNMLFTERRMRVCGVEMLRGRAGMGAWKGRLQGSALPHFKAVGIMNDYQVQSHRIS